MRPLRAGDFVAASDHHASRDGRTGYSMTHVLKLVPIYRHAPSSPPLRAERKKNVG